MAFGAIGMFSASRLTHLAGYAAILSSGTLLAATGFGQNLLTAGLLYYLPSSTLAVSALFLVADLVDRWRSDGPHQDDDAPFLAPDLKTYVGLNLDEDEEVPIGKAIPAAAAVLGLCFMVCTLVIAGLPPLSGFVGKLAMLTALLNPLGLGSSAGHHLSASGWMLFGLLIATGLLALIALTRAGIRCFWAQHERPAPQLRMAEGLPIAALLGACAVLAVQADPMIRFTQATANALHSPAVYISAVMSAAPKPGPVTPTPDATEAAQ